MSLQPDTLQRELEKAFESLAKQKDIDLAAKIRSILQANWDRKRVQKFVEGNPSSLDEYVRRVVEKFGVLNTYIHQLQIERADDIWDPLLKNMQKWAYRFLVRQGYDANKTTWEHAKECADDAARSILIAYFPYDTDFEPWARVVVRNACLKFIRSAASDPPVLEESLEDLEDTLRIFSGSAFQDEDRRANEQSDLFAAIEKLSGARRQVIEMKYFQDLSPIEIATKLGKSVRAIHSLQFRALEDLRKILTQNRNKFNE